jgi:hypothetical protein
MKTHNVLVVIFLALSGFQFLSCTKESESVKNSSRLGLIPFHSSIIPIQPTSNDEVFIVDSCCGYEQFQTLSLKDFEIKYSRIFNSLMGLPCILDVDTVSLGKLSEGRYTLVYNLIDIANINQKLVVRTDTLYFEVK